MNNDLYIQEEIYSSDVSDHSLSTKTEVKEEQSPTDSLSNPNSSKVEKVNIYQLLYIVVIILRIMFINSEWSNNNVNTPNKY